MGEFLNACWTEGRVERIIEWYRRSLKYVYDNLSEDKTTHHGMLERWRENLIRQGYAFSTISSFLPVSNSYLDFAGHQEYQLIGRMEQKNSPQPEQARAECLRLLQTA